MIQVRSANERGHTTLDWLDSYHTFSFDQYYDPRYMNFRQLRVLNDDRVKPGAGFGMHSHRDMEIVTYVLEGTLAHRDSAGGSSVIRPGEVQRMSAGTGISHSEYNHSQTEPVHFLQVWILPQQKGLAPGYEQRIFPIREDRGRLHLVAARDGRAGAVAIHQDVDLYAGVLMKRGDRLSHRLQPDRHGWLQVAGGRVMLNGIALGAGDGAAVSEQETLEITAAEASEILLFDLA